MRGMKKAPVFAPSDLTAMLSKAAWVDVAWNLAAQLSTSADDAEQILIVLRGEMRRVQEERAK